MPLENLPRTPQNKLRLKAAKQINRYLIKYGIDPTATNLKQLGLQQSDIQIYYGFLKANRAGVRDLLALYFCNLNKLTHNFEANFNEQKAKAS